MSAARVLRALAVSRAKRKKRLATRLPIGPMYNFVAIVSRADRPLYLQSFDADSPRFADDYLKYNFLAHIALDIFASPASLNLRERAAGSDVVLLFVQDGVMVYGFESNTNLKILVGVSASDPAGGAALAPSEQQLAAVVAQIHRSYLRVICNPFADATADAALELAAFDRAVRQILAT